MEGNPRPTGESPLNKPPVPGGERLDKDKDSKKKKSTGGKEVPKPALDALFEKAEKAEAVNKGETIWQRLVGEEKTKATAEEKPAEPTGPEKDKSSQSEAADKPEASPVEGEIPLSHEEAREVASGYIDLRRGEVRQELGEARRGTEHAAAAAADERLLEKAQQKIEKDQQASVEESLGQAYEQTAAELAAEAKTAEAPEDQSAHSSFEELAEEAMKQRVAAATVSPEGAPAEPDNPPQNTRSANYAAGPMSSPAIEQGRREAAEASDLALAGGTPEGWGTQHPERAVGREWYPSLVPWRGAVWNRYGRNFMNRRRERLRTDKKINAAERDLEKQVYRVQEQVAEREVGIRKLAAEQTRLRGEQQASRKTGESVPPHGHERYVASIREAIMPPPPMPPEGHIARPSEALVPRRPEERPKPQSPEKPIDPRVEALPQAELLRESAAITVSGVTLRSIYEAKRISEPGLRRLVSEYHRGGDMQLALAEEMVEHERSFERDPIMRDDHPMYDWLYGGNSPIGTEARTSRPAASAVASDTDKPAAAGNVPRSSQTRDRRLSDAQFMTAGFTILLILIILIVMALQR